MLFFVDIAVVLLFYRNLTFDSSRGISCSCSGSDSGSGSGSGSGGSSSGE